MKNKEMDYSPLWNRYLPMFEDAELSETQVGALTMAILKFQARGEKPANLDPVCKALWAVIHQDLLRARLKYDTAVKNGKKGGRPPKASKHEEETNENQEKGITKTESKTKSESESKSTSKSTSIDTGSAPAQAAGVCCEKESFGEFGWIKLTMEQYRKLLERLGPEELNRCITYVDEAAQSTGNRNRWKDWYLILRRCHENRWYETRQKYSKPDVPYGATGVLGEAELEAIQRVLRE